MKIAVFCPNPIGDTVMATPTFRAIRRGFAGATILAVVKPQVAPTLDGAPWFDDRVLFDPQAHDRSVRTGSVLKRLRAERLDLAALLPNSFRIALLALAAGIPRRIGYARGGRAFLLTDRLDAARDKRGRRLPSPAVAYFLEIARRLGCQVDSGRTELFTTAADEAAADRAWERLGLPAGEPVVCLNTGGAYGPAKDWPTEHFVALARLLAQDTGVSVLVVCGPAERAKAREIEVFAEHPRVVSLSGEPLSIGLTKACIRRSALLITTDSGPRHFAPPFNVPVLTLFGPTHMAWTRTHHPASFHILRPVPCGPCQKRICPLGHHRCMKELLPEAVYKAAMRILAGSPDRSRRAS
jgi:heptosyltransferase-2